MRYTHPKLKWFVDVPKTASPFFDHQNVRMSIELQEREKFSHGIEMHGIVVKKVNGWVVVSCDGLFASGPCAHDVTPGCDAHVYIS